MAVQAAIKSILSYSSWQVRKVDFIKAFEKIPDTLLMLSRKKKQPPVNPFKFPDHPARTIPPEKSLAMDQQFSDDFTWASSFIGSTIEEGQQFLGYAVLSALSQRAEYRVVSEVIANEMTREWIKLTSTGTDDKTDKIKELDQEIKKFKLRELFKTVAEFDGFMGRAHIYVDTGDTENREELSKSIGDGKDLTSRSKIKKGGLKAFRHVEAIWCYPTQYESTNPLRANWYKPTTWYVMGNELHHTRLLTFIGRPVPDMLKPAYSFGGLSMTQMLKPYVDNWLRTRQSVADIVNSFTVFLLKTPLSQQMYANGGQQLWDRVELFNNLRNNQSMMVINKDTEDFSNVSAPLGTLDQIQAQSQEHMAAVAQIPLIKLLGIQPAGLNASSEGEIRTFYDRIKAHQENLFRDHLQTCIWFIELHLWGKVDPEISFDFNGLWQLDELSKMSAEKVKADIHDAYVAMGAIDPEEVRKAVAFDEDSLYSGLDLKEREAPGELGEEGQEGQEEGEGEEKDEEGHNGGGGANPRLKPGDPAARIANEIANKASRFGAPASGGFSADKERTINEYGEFLQHSQRTE